MNLTLTKEVIGAIQAQYEANDVRVVIYPGSLDIKDPFLVITEQQRTEIVIVKSTLIKLFLQCHNLFYQLEHLDEETRQTVIAGLLLVTTENRTVLNQYKKWLVSVDSGLLPCQIRFMERLLSSNYARLNKSSSLWQLYRYMITKHGRQAEFHVWGTISLSCEQHFANYYCCNFVRWYYSRLTAVEKEQFTEQFLTFAKKHLNDPSIWAALGSFISQSHFEQIVSFIDSLPVTTWPPFQAVLDFASRNDKAASRVQTQWKQDNTITLYKGTPVAPPQVQKDLLRLCSYMNRGWRTLLLKKLIRQQMGN